MARLEPVLPQTAPLRPPPCAPACGAKLHQRLTLACARTKSRLIARALHSKVTPKLHHADDGASARAFDGYLKEVSQN